MTDLFKCRKSGTQCCAPKSVIKEHLDKKNGIESNSRNDTIFSPPFEHHPPYRSTPAPGYNLPHTPTPPLPHHDPLLLNGESSCHIKWHVIGKCDDPFVSRSTCGPRWTVIQGQRCWERPISTYFWMAISPTANQLFMLLWCGLRFGFSFRQITLRSISHFRSKMIHSRN